MTTKNRIYLFNFGYTALTPSTVAPAFYSARLQSPLEGWGLSATSYFRHSGGIQEKGGGEERFQQKMKAVDQRRAKNIFNVSQSLEWRNYTILICREIKRVLYFFYSTECSSRKTAPFLVTKVVSSLYDVISNV